MAAETSVLYSDEEMLSCIDFKKSMPLSKRCALQNALTCRVVHARGRLRSEFQGITYSDFKNLYNYSYSMASQSQVWVPLKEELQSILEEYERCSRSTTSKLDNSDLLGSQVPEHKPKLRKPKPGSNRVRIGDDRIPVPMDIPSVDQQIIDLIYHNGREKYLTGLINNPIPSIDQQIVHRRYHNSGEQHMTGLINNQSRYVSGNGNGSYIVTVIQDCNFHYERKQMAN